MSYKLSVLGGVIEGLIVYFESKKYIQCRLLLKNIKGKNNAANYKHFTATYKKYYNHLHTMRTIGDKCPKGYNMHSPVVLTRGIQNVGIDPGGVEQNSIIVPPRWGSACNY